MPSAEERSTVAGPRADRLPTVEPEEASPEVRSVYADFQRRMGFPAAPNFIKAQGHSLAAATGTWGLVSNVLVGGALPRTVKELLFVAISHDRNCRYCEAAHIACCRMLGVKAESLSQLISDVQNLTDNRLRDIISFGLKCSRNPQSLTEADFDVLRKHGMKQSEIVELIAMSAFAVYANIMADATKMEPDEMFSQI